MTTSSLAASQPRLREAARWKLRSHCNSFRIKCLLYILYTSFQLNFAGLEISKKLSSIQLTTDICTPSPFQTLFRIWNSAQGIRNPAEHWNPQFQFHFQRIRNPVLGIRSKAIFENLTWGNSILPQTSYKLRIGKVFQKFIIKSSSFFRAKIRIVFNCLFEGYHIGSKRRREYTEW